jgi:3-hydroxyacyl-[acyl-carrier-protein] dehydratase
MNSEQIISNLPYAPPFLFVDALTEVSENGVLGNYIFKEEA